MEIRDKVIVITGGAGGIGAAMGRRFAAEGAKVALADLDPARAEAAAAQIGGIGLGCDVTREAEVQALVQAVEARLGPVDIFISNAGVGFGEPDHAASAGNDVWQTCWDVHVMAHVYAARALLPGMIARGEGYLVSTASAAGLLNQIGDAAYSATKHAAVSLAESLHITHRDDGVRVSVICPQYVATAMLGYDDPGAAPDHPGLITPDAVAETVLEGLQREAFLILPHPVVAQYVALKSADYERWLAGMRKLRRKSIETVGSTRADKMHLLV